MSGHSLSLDEIRGFRDELAAGGTPTVWFTPEAVGVSEGRSGKVLALDDAEEGDFIQVRPAGSKDVLSFSVTEVTTVKPPRKRKNPANAGDSQQKSPEVGSSHADNSAVLGNGQSTTSRGAPGGGIRSENTAAPNRRKTAGRLRPATITLTTDTEGQWRVEVSHGKKRLLRSTPVPAPAVAQAAKTLHTDVANAVEPLLEAAREQQRAKVEQLRQELADAQRMLEELTLSGSP